MLYAENGDIVGTYEYRDAAERALATFVGEHPMMRDEIGLRAYRNGRPVGDFERVREDD